MRNGTIQHLETLNPELTIISVEDKRFKGYGRVIVHPYMDRLLERAAPLIPSELPENKYIASVPELEALPGKELYNLVFGDTDIQVGYVAGPNMTLNGLEYHKSPEVIIALTDQMLLLGKWEDIDDNWHYDANRVLGLYVKAGECIELYPRVLHYSPCRLSDQGFKTLIVLPRGTNTPLSEETLAKRISGTESQCLFMKNKWLLAHPDRLPLIQKGAYPGIRGKNILVQYK